MASKRISPDEAFELGDVVETDYSGKVTRHIVTNRFLTRNSQSGVTYTLYPAVPKSGGKDAKIDHGWFRRIARIEFDENDRPYAIRDKTE